MRRLRLVTTLLCLALVVPAAAQDMPDPSLIHGRALPAPELPNGTVTVRVVREAIGNNISGQTVSLTVGSAARSATTDEQGRAEFSGLPAGQAMAVATVAGEALTSQPFEVPVTGGLRVILVAGIARAAERKAAEEKEAASAPPVKGVVVLGGNSRVLMQFNNDNLEVYYVLDVINNARARVDIGGPLVIMLPPQATGASALDGSSRTASVNARTLTITGPFAPGTTSVQVGFTHPYSGGELLFEQTFPVPMQQVTVGVQKVGEMTIASRQFSTINDVRPDGTNVYALGTGPALQAGTPLSVTISNLPHHSDVPLYVAVGLAVAVAGVGLWLAVAARRSGADMRAALEGRREALLAQLVQLEGRRRSGAIDADRYLTRRQRLTRELEQVYGELDEVSLGPRGGGEGVAA